jgi:hypothetical protein
VTWFEGKRTYVIGAVMAAINFICAMNWYCLNSQQLIALDGFLAALGLIFMRSSVAKVQNTASETQDTMDSMQ